VGNKSITLKQMQTQAPELKVDAKIKVAV